MLLALDDAGAGDEKQIAGANANALDLEGNAQVVNLNHLIAAWYNNLAQASLLRNYQ